MNQRGLAYLAQQQRKDGSWLPLWFGNQHAPDDINPVYGTAKVLAAYRDLGIVDRPQAQRGIEYLLSVQNADGGWGGARDTPSSVEETALAVEALLEILGTRPQAPSNGGWNIYFSAWKMARLSTQLRSGSTSPSYGTSRNFIQGFSPLPHWAGHTISQQIAKDYEHSAAQPLPMIGPSINHERPP